jgi:hypothetical protein
VLEVLREGRGARLVGFSDVGALRDAVLATLEDFSQRQAPVEDNIRAVARYSLGAGLAGFDTILFGSRAA